VIGKSGSGKSTLINMITGIDHPTAGEVYVGGSPVHTMSENEMAAWRGRTLGIVFQFFQLLPMLSLVENIMLPMDFCNLYTARQRKERAMELLRLVEMETTPASCHGDFRGQQQVAIARPGERPARDPGGRAHGNLDTATAGPSSGCSKQSGRGRRS
jgi:putative ABC transport system ATP-binding protein